MKEYRAVSWNMELTNNNEWLEDTLTEFAKQGWKIIHIAENSATIVFERDKNR